MGLACPLSIIIGRMTQGVSERYLGQPLAAPSKNDHANRAIVILFRTSASVHSALSRSTQTEIARLPRIAGSAKEQETTDMANGTVKWFNTQKGFGFIAPETGGKDVFVHISSLERSGMTGLTDDQKVTYDVEEGRDGRESAVNLALA